MSPEESQSILPQQISQAPADLLISWHRLWSSVWPTDFLLDSSLGFVQASQRRSLCSFGGSSTPEIRYALSRYHPGSQNIDPNHLLLQIAWGCLSKSSHSLPFSWILWPWRDSQFQTHWIIPYSIILPPPCFTLEMMCFGLSICPFLLQT